MKTKIRRARLVAYLAATIVRARRDVRALERCADRGEPVADRAALLEHRLSEAVARIDREFA